VKNGALTPPFEGGSKEGCLEILFDFLDGKFVSAHFTNNV
jgi:hypothetical protein